MKGQFYSILALISLLLSCSAAFVVQPQGPPRLMTFLAGTFDGKSPRITIREDEDAAMWIEEPKTKNKPKAKKASPSSKKPAAKKTSDKKKAEPFKFPWQK